MKSFKYISNNDYVNKCKMNLYKKYCKNITNEYNLLKINTILTNRKTHIISLFKVFLLFDDISEFLRRFYKANESNIRVKKLSKYYKEISILYPNYSPLI